MEGWLGVQGWSNQGRIPLGEMSFTISLFQRDFNKGLLPTWTSEMARRRLVTATWSSTGQSWQILPHVEVENIQDNTIRNREWVTTLCDTHSRLLLRCSGAKSNINWKASVIRGIPDTLNVCRWRLAESRWISPDGCESNLVMLNIPIGDSTNTRRSRNQMARGQHGLVRISSHWPRWIFSRTRGYRAGGV